MAKNKQQKKKERERRVAQKKLAAAAKKRSQEKSADQTKTSVPERTKFMTGGVAKPEYVPSSKKSPFTQRRSGG